MLTTRLSLAGLACAVALSAQAPTAPVISARGVTNYFTQEPAPGVVALGGLVQISGLNLGPPAGAKASGIPWPTRLANIQVVIGGKAAAIYSVSPGTIIAQVAPDANTGLVDVIVRSGADSSAPARVTVSALAPAIRTANDSGFGVPWGTVTATTITTTADGLGPTKPPIALGDVGPSDTLATPTTALTAYVGGLRATVTATASTKRPAEFDVTINVPAGARPGDIVTLVAGRQVANLTIFQPATAPDVQYVPLPDGAPPVNSLADSGVDGSYLLALGVRGPDGCYPAAAVNLQKKSIDPIADCLTSAAAALAPVAVPNDSDTIGALIGPPTGTPQTGVSTSVKIFSAAADPVPVTLPSPAATLTATATGLVATLPGTPPQIASIDPVSGAIQTADAPAPPGAGGLPKVNVNGLTNVYASANLGQNRVAVIVGDDPLKPTKATYAIVNGAGDVLLSKDFPSGWLPLLNTVAPARTGQTAPPPPPTEPIVFDAASRLFFALARAADASKDAFLAFALTDTDPKMVALPDGWFAASCTADIRLLSLDLVGRWALAGARVAEPAFKTNCSASGFLILDPAKAAVTAVPFGDQGLLRVPTNRTDTSMALMNNYVYGAKLDTTRAGTSHTLYVLDGVNGSAFVMPVPDAVDGVSNATLQQIPEVNSLLVQTVGKAAGDQGLVLFDLDAQTVTALPLPEGFATVANLDDGATVCCLVTQKLAARALKPGGSNVVIYNLVTGDITVVPNPEGVTSVGPPGGAAASVAAAARLVIANARANTISAVAYNAGKQVGIMVVRVP